MKKLEYCAICDEPTGNAGVLDDSIKCGVCGQTICENCIGHMGIPDDDCFVICVECLSEFEIRGV